MHVLIYKLLKHAPTIKELEAEIADANRGRSTRLLPPPFPRDISYYTYLSRFSIKIVPFKSIF